LLREDAKLLGEGAFGHLLKPSRFEEVEELAVRAVRNSE
jgi:hypothetical protein